MSWQRRQVLGAGALALLMPWLPAQARGLRGAKVLVVGGGFAGSTCAITLKRWQPELDVVLIDDRPQALTGPMSNAVLAGLRDRAASTRRLDALDTLGIRRVVSAVVDVDPVQRRVRDASGHWHHADRLVIAPGIAPRWGLIEGLDAQSSLAMPHAWLDDGSMEAFRQRFSALRDGATVLFVTPPNPYRCPPGPYERASLCAWALSRQGHRSKLLIADAKDDFSKRGLFQMAWDTHYPGMIDWLPRAQGGEVVEVDPGGRWAKLANGERIEADLICAIPAQRAAEVCVSGDLVDETGWCPVAAADFQSLRHPGVHVIGDACIAHPMPKSAFAANSQAKLCALAIIAALAERAPPEVRLINTCYSLTRPDQAVSVSGLYGLAGGRLSALHEASSPLIADTALREREAVDALDGYRSLVADSFAQVLPA